MINEDYCSFEVAKLLKEKGFNEPVTELNKLLIKEGEKPVLKITHQKAMKWLRETRDIVISIFPTIETDMIVREDYNYAIYKNKTVVYQSCSTSYEEACEAAIRCCLENLI